MFPTLQAQRPGEAIPEYASRVLRAILQDPIHLHSASVQDLEYADMAAQRAAASMPTDKADRSSVPVLATLARLSETRHLIQTVIRHRQAREADRLAALLDQVYGFPTNSEGFGGRKSPLIPPTPSLPPAGDALLTPGMQQIAYAISTAKEAEQNGSRPTTKPDGFNISF